MINNKRLLWGIGAAVFLVNAIVAYVLMQKRRAARKRTPLQSAMQVAEDALQTATQSVEETAAEVVKASRRGISRLRENIGK